MTISLNLHCFFVVGLTAFMASYAWGNELEEQDPVRVAQRLKDCIAENRAQHDGRTYTAIRRACRKAVAEKEYSDPNLSLDGMIKTPPRP